MFERLMKLIRSGLLIEEGSLRLNSSSLIIDNKPTNNFILPFVANHDISSNDSSFELEVEPLNIIFRVARTGSANPVLSLKSYYGGNIDLDILILSNTGFTGLDGETITSSWQSILENISMNSTSYNFIRIRNRNTFEIWETSVFSSGNGQFTNIISKQIA